MKNKNIGDVFWQLNLISKKIPMQKCKKLSNIEKIFSLVSLTRHFTKFIFLEQLTAIPEFNIYLFIYFIFFVLFCFFLFSKQSS